MDHLLYVLDRIEELLRELIVAEVRGVKIEPKGFDVIHNLVHVCCELVDMLWEGVGLPPSPKIIQDKGVAFVTDFPHAKDEETLSIPERLPDLIEEEESQPRSSLDSSEEFV